MDVRLDEVVLRSLESEPDRRYQQVSEVKTEVEAIVRGGTRSEAADVDVHTEAERLERLILSYSPGRKTAAVKAYRDETGAGVAEAKNAVEAIARKHHIQFTPIPLWQRFAGVATICTAAALVIAASILFNRHVDLSPIINWMLMLICLAPVAYFLGVSAWRRRGTKQGRLAAFLAGLFLFIIVGVPLLGFLATPEPALNSLYEVTGVTPGRHDLAFLHVLGMGVVLGFLAWLIWFLGKLRAKPRYQQAAQ